MLKLLIGIISLIVVLLLLTLTNPSRKRHQSVIKEKASPLIDELLTTMADSTSSTAIHERLSGKPGMHFRHSIVDSLLKNGISRTNYVLFSTSTLDYKGHRATIGYGVLFMVYIDANADKLIRRIGVESVR